MGAIQMHSFLKSATVRVMKYRYPVLAVPLFALALSHPVIHLLLAMHRIALHA